MKNLNSILIILLFIVAGCGENKQPAGDFITVDVTAKYPQKKLILQDFMDVEYIPLETTDEFLCQGSLWAVGKDVIVASNFNTDGNIFIFDRKGKALRKINRKGQGGEEYTTFSRIVLDEENGEIFANDAYAKKILVYDLEGNFKRSLSINKDFSLFEMYSFDQENLICRDAFNDYGMQASHTGQSLCLYQNRMAALPKRFKYPLKKRRQL